MNAMEFVMKLQKLCIFAIILVMVASRGASADTSEFNSAIDASMKYPFLSIVFNNVTDELYDAYRDGIEGDLADLEVERILYVDADAGNPFAFPIVRINDPSLKRDAVIISALGRPRTYTYERERINSQKLKKFSLVVKIDGSKRLYFALREVAKWRAKKYAKKLNDFVPELKKKLHKMIELDEVIIYHSEALEALKGKNAQDAADIEESTNNIKESKKRLRIIDEQSRWRTNAAQSLYASLSRKNADLFKATQYGFLIADALWETSIDKEIDIPRIDLLRTGINPKTGLLTEKVAAEIRAEQQ